MDYVYVTNKDFDTADYLAKLTHPECGGTAVFIGTSRSTSRQSVKPVIALDYQAYIPMAEHQLKKICADMRQKNSLHVTGNIVLAHRVGYVPIGQPGLFVGVSAPHRKEAIESMDWAIFQIKAKVPVWKQEVYEDQTRAWTVNCECYWLSPSSQTTNNEAQLECLPSCHPNHHHHNQRNTSVHDVQSFRFDEPVEEACEINFPA